MTRQKWYVWDSRGGLREHPTHCEIVNFDLPKNMAAWKSDPMSKVTGSIESGRLTYEHFYGSTVDVKVELWREDQPNPTPYTIFDNPDPIDPDDGDARCHPSS